MKRITTFFGYTLTSAEVAQGIDLVENRALVPGSASGIDIETVQALTPGGAAVAPAVRWPNDASADDQIRTSTRNSAVDVELLDLTDLEARCNSFRSSQNIDVMKPDGCINCRQISRT